MPPCAVANMWRYEGIFNPAEVRAAGAYQKMYKCIKR